MITELSVMQTEVAPAVKKDAPSQAAIGVGCGLA